MPQVAPLLPRSSTAPQSLASGLLVPDQAAEFLGLKPKTLAKDRCTREIGIPYVKLGRSVRYRLSDLEKFISDRVVA